MWEDELEPYNNLGQNTAREIAHQPQLWKKIWEKVDSQKKEIHGFLDKVLKDCDGIILTGAGTSAYIGIAVQSTFRKKMGIIAEPISTTHIVSHPQDFLLPSKNVLLVSFARSGNSPESCATVHLANQHCKKAYHFIITCNGEGRLAQDNETKENAFVFVLPKESNDKSLAMTSSFTGMALSSILISRIDEISALEKEVDTMAEYGEFCLNQAHLLKEIASKDFKRAIFLGSGPFYGIAKEAQLKMLELSDGVVMCKHDSFLGLRHGPKAVIDEQTLLVHHMSNDIHANKYEVDLITSMRKKSHPIGQLAIGESLKCQEYIDWAINFKVSDHPLDEDLLAIVSVLPSQILALFKSFQIGLSPDSPSRNGAITRVVEGVSIYDL